MQTEDQNAKDKVAKASKASGKESLLWKDAAEFAEDYAYDWGLNFEQRADLRKRVQALYRVIEKQSQTLAEWEEHRPGLCEVIVTLEKHIEKLDRRIGELEGGL